jgi:hypothetical protein
MAYKTVLLDGKAVSQLVTNAAATLPGTLGNVSAAGAFTVAADNALRLFVFGDNQQSTDGTELVAAGAGGNAYQINDGDLRTLILAASQTVNKNDKLYIGASGQVTKTTTGGLVGYAESSVTTGVGVTAQIAVCMA